MTSGTLVAGDWYRAHPRPWGPTLAFDQMLGGGLMLTLAEIVALPFLIAVFFQWWHEERDRSAELDARLDAELVPVAAPVAAAAAQGGNRSAAAPAQEGADATAAATVPPTAAAGAAAGAERVRPWWETDDGEVGQRMRRHR
jgi:Cytochrome c oxidase caa3 assembly factor (Caa3_CtaG)